MSVQDLVPNIPDTLTEPALDEAFPAALARVGRAACFGADEFFSAWISNPHTRRAYARAVGEFLSWWEALGL